MPPPARGHRDLFKRLHNPLNDHAVAAPIAAGSGKLTKCDCRISRHQTQGGSVTVMAVEGIPVEEVACRILDVATSGYYKWPARPPLARSVRRARLTD